MNLKKLYEAGAVKRWHTKTTIKDQDVASHSWGVALVLLKIAPGDYELIRAALLHDMAEVESGDIPYPFKRNHPIIHQQLLDHEAQFESDNGTLCHLTDKQTKTLKWADMFELLLWCKRELKMGNEHMKYTIDVAFRALRDMGHPNEIARKLFEEETKMSLADNHYRKDGEEHQRRAIRLQMNWYQGNITKYAERAPHKGSQNADLLKVLDYTTMWLESPDKSVNAGMLNEDDRRKVLMIAERLNALAGNASGAKAAQEAFIRPYKEIAQMVPTGAVMPGYGSVIDPRREVEAKTRNEGAAQGRGYVNQDQVDPYLQTR